MRKTALYTNKELEIDSETLGEESAVVMLFPFWPSSCHNRGHVFDDRYDEWVARGREYFSLTSAEAADYAVFPTQWVSVQNRHHSSFQEKLQSFVQQSCGRPILMFFQHDSEEEIDFTAGGRVFRTSFYRATRKPNEHAIPYFVPDILQKYCGGNFRLREKRGRPVIGFCGYMGYWYWMLRGRVGRLRAALRRPIASWSTGAVDRTATYEARRRAVRALRQSKAVETHIDLRRDKWGGFGSFRLPDGTLDLARISASHREYVDNMLNSDYVLCTRGDGNYSLRFYEALAAGRIPVLIDTDCVLPYDHIIDYKEFCVWVEYKNVKKTAEAVERFHGSLSPCQFRNIQMRCREVWVEYLSPTGFFRNISLSM